jgi:hypothetical protein
VGRLVHSIVKKKLKDEDMDSIIASHVAAVTHRAKAELHAKITKQAPRSIASYEAMFNNLSI